MIDLLSKKVTFHLYSVLPYLSFVIGIIVALIFLYFYFYSKNKIFIRFFHLAFFVSLYNLWTGNIFYLKDQVEAVFYYKVYFAIGLFALSLFIYTIYKIIEKDPDKILYLIITIAGFFLLLNIRSMFFRDVVKIEGFQYIIKPTFIYYLYIIMVYAVFSYGAGLLLKNIKSIRENINVPLFVKSFFGNIILMIIFSFTDVLNGLGFVKVPPLFSLSILLYLLVMLFEVARSQVLYYMILKKSYLQTIVGLADLIDSRDQYTYKHSYRVSRYALFIAERLNFNEEMIQRLRTASLLHDIGKIGINDKVLLKKGKLSANEWVEMKKHPEKGESILKLVSFLEKEAELVRHHHESYDGKGYPDGLVNDEIHLDVVVLSLADCFDAMTSDRPYRKRLSLKDVQKEFKRIRGQQFSRELIDLILKHWDQLIKLYKNFEKTEKLAVKR
ncbi:MAG: HD-GYP domain-containing protein [Spirochaetes bacterium]|nr:HD-GYP domain-containing protein [Spirochaetota bacterium]